MINKFKNNFILIILLIITIFFISNTTDIIKLISNNTTIFIYKIFPSLFFFFIISDLLIEFNFINILNNTISKVFKVNSSSTYVLIISMISGFPSGAKNIIKLMDKKILNTDRANLLITYTHFSNIAFILGFIGSILKDNKLTIIILISHFISNFIIAIFINTDTKYIYNKINKNNSNLGIALSNSIISNIKVLVLIYGTMIFFSTFSYVICNILPINNYIKLFINGLLDLSSGINTLNTISMPIFNKSLLILIFISFGSISVHMQVKMIINNTKIKYSNYLLGRISQVGISILLYLLIYRCFY